MDGPQQVDVRAKEIVDIWNARRAVGGDVWMYPTIAAAIAAGCHWLHFICTVCQRGNAVDLRCFDGHRAASICSVIPEIACAHCRRPGEVRLLKLSPDARLEFSRTP